MDATNFSSLLLMQKTRGNECDSSNTWDTDRTPTWSSWEEERAKQQGPDLRYLRRAIRRRRGFLDSRILIQILDVVMNNFGTSWEQPNFGTSWEQPSFGCSHEVGFLAFWPWKWPWRSILTTDLESIAFVPYVNMVLFALRTYIDCLKRLLRVTLTACSDVVGFLAF